MLIQCYQATWESQFKQIREILEAALGGAQQSIEHIGSTAVPGLAAKPIIDIDIVYKNVVDFSIIKDRLEAIGYYHNGDQGITDRAVFKRRGTSTQVVLDQIKHHLYACSSSSKELQRHLQLRDYLRQNVEARNQYQQLKYSIAEEAEQDRKRYAQLKEIKARSLIESFLSLAIQ